MPTLTIRHNSLGTIIVIRNPFNGAWIMNLTIARKRTESLPIEFRPINALAKASYACTFIALVLVFFVGCESPTNVPAKGITTDHPTACVESFPVVPDTIVKGLEKWSLKVGDGPRNRCSFDNANEFVQCHSKVKGDTLYTIDRYCPATLKARAELGGN